MVGKNAPLQRKTKGVTVPKQETTIDARMIGMSSVFKLTLLFPKFLELFGFPII